MPRKIPIGYRFDDDGEIRIDSQPWATHHVDRHGGEWLTYIPSNVYGAATTLVAREKPTDPNHNERRTHAR